MAARRDFVVELLCSTASPAYSAALDRSVAQLGSALDWGSRGRRFESGRSDQYAAGGPSLLPNNPSAFASFLDVCVAPSPPQARLPPMLQAVMPVF